MPELGIELFGLSEPVLRLSVFAAVLGTLMALETIAPKKHRVLARAARWWTNGGMLVLATLLVRLSALAAPIFVVGTAAILAEQQNFGILHQAPSPNWIEFVLALALLDAAIWLQHVLSHKLPILWRFHKVHHSDRDLDATSALRFHPVEILLSAVYKFSVVLLLGAPLVAVIVFEILLNACAMFNHANIKLPSLVDKLLRMILVTPDMHRVHHSVHTSEQIRNYGFCLSVWDRLFQTYQAQPRDGHRSMMLGLEEHQSTGPSKLGWSLKLPF